MVANPPASRGEGIRVPYDLHSFIELAPGGCHHITRDIHPDRANLTTGRGSVGWRRIHDRHNLSVDHLGDEMTLLMASKTNGGGLHP
jgi:hypothetical protein